MGLSSAARPPESAPVVISALLMVFGCLISTVSFATQTPTNGMSMDDVRASLGNPDKVLPAVGTPPITRWVYPDFTVYFEYNLALDTVYQVDTTDVSSAKANPENSAVEENDSVDVNAIETNSNEPVKSTPAATSPLEQPSPQAAATSEPPAKGTTPTPSHTPTAEDDISVNSIDDEAADATVQPPNTTKQSMPIEPKPNTESGIADGFRFDAATGRVVPK